MIREDKGPVGRLIRIFDRMAEEEAVAPARRPGFFAQGLRRHASPMSSYVIGLLLIHVWFGIEMIDGIAAFMETRDPAPLDRAAFFSWAMLGMAGLSAPTIRYRPVEERWGARALVCGLPAMLAALVLLRLRDHA